MTEVVHPDGRMSQYPPSSSWDRWVEWDSKAWPKRVAREYTLVPTTCFNCESGCGLLAYVDRKTLGIKSLKGILHTREAEVEIAQRGPLP